MSETINKLSEYALDDTIAAIATPIGNGGISIVRLSGKNALSIGCRLSKIDNLVPRYMKYSQLYTQYDLLIDDALVVYMPEPHSYTGEDVVELQCHGGSQIPAKILSESIAAGARLAKPGEFTLRAFLNGRIDLTQAEAVGDLIQAPTPQAAQMLAEQVSGRLRQALIPIEDELLDVLAMIEVGVDFPDDEDALSALEAIDKIVPIKKKIDELLEGAEQGRIIKEGINVCLLGVANVGKSSLLNALLAEDRAIVTHIAGTTRDVIEEYINLGGLPILLSDTAGLRKAGDEVEAIGIDKTRQKAEKAQLILLVLDCSREITAEEKKLLATYANRKMIVILNKNDLADGTSIEKYLKDQYSEINYLSISAKTKNGLEQLEKAIKKLVFKGDLQGKRTSLVNNIRHQEALLIAREALNQAVESLKEGCPTDLVSIDLQCAWQAFGAISGKTAGEEVITKIFSKFCLGK